MKILGKTSVCTSRTANGIRRFTVQLASYGFYLYHTSRFFLINKTLETTYAFVQTTRPPRTQKKSPMLWSRRTRTARFRKET